MFSISKTRIVLLICHFLTLEHQKSFDENIGVTPCKPKTSDTFVLELIGVSKSTKKRDILTVPTRYVIAVYYFSVKVLSFLFLIFFQFMRKALCKKNVGAFGNKRQISVSKQTIKFFLFLFLLLKQCLRILKPV